MAGFGYWPSCAFSSPDKKRTEERRVKAGCREREEKKEEKRNSGPVVMMFKHQHYSRQDIFLWLVGVLLPCQLPWQVAINTMKYEKVIFRLFIEDH